MRLVLAILVIVISWAVFAEGASAIAGNLFHRADYQQCFTVRNGPIQRPDHYGLPFQRKKDVA